MNRNPIKLIAAPLRARKRENGFSNVQCRSRTDFNAFTIFAISGRFICCAIVSSNSVIGSGYIADLIARTISSASNANSRQMARVKPSTCDRPGSLLNSPASIYSINRVEMAVFADNFATVILLFFLQFVCIAQLPARHRLRLFVPYLPLGLPPHPRVVEGKY